MDVSRPVESIMPLKLGKGDNGVDITHFSYIVKTCGDTSNVFIQPVLIQQPVTMPSPHISRYVTISIDVEVYFSFYYLCSLIDVRTFPCRLLMSTRKNFFISTCTAAHSDQNIENYLKERNLASIFFSIASRSILIVWKVNFP